MAALHFIGGEKGGVGKSVLARTLAQYHIDRNLPFLGFDTDRSHPTLSSTMSPRRSRISPSAPCWSIWQPRPSRHCRAGWRTPAC